MTTAAGFGGEYEASQAINCYRGCVIVAVFRSGDSGQKPMLDNEVRECRWIEKVVID